MPSIFKGLISIIVWILFIKGCIGVILTESMLMGSLLGGQPAPIDASIASAVTSFAFILACIAAWIRKKVE